MNKFLAICFLFTACQTSTIKNTSDSDTLTAPLIQLADTLGPELFTAVQQNNYDLTVELLNKGANANYLAGNPYPRTSLIVAVSNENVEIVEALLVSEADPNMAIPAEGGSRCPLSAVGVVGNIEILKLLIQYGATDLIRAMGSAYTFENLDLALYLDSLGVKILDEYLSFTQSSELIRLAIKRGVDPNYYYAGGDYIAYPKLYSAIGLGDTIMIQELINGGADPKIALSDSIIAGFGSSKIVTPVDKALEILEYKRNKSSSDTSLYLRIIEMLYSDKV